MVAVTVFSLLAVAAGIAVATGGTAPAVTLEQTGHWVYNSAAGAALHVDGGTRRTDARVDIPDPPAEPLFTVQGATQGFLVARDKVVVFGRSTLTVDSSFPVGFTEVPVGIETVGGPYLVYREAGTIVRLGVPPTSIQAGGRLGRPVWTDDGTVWVQRLDDGGLCSLHAGADALDCGVWLPGSPGGLTVTSDEAAYVATTPDEAQLLAAGPGPAVGLGTDVPDNGLIADRDTRGRLPVVDSGTNRLQLVDTAGVPAGVAGGPGAQTDLGAGRFSAPVAADGVVAVIDELTNRLLTFDTSARLLQATFLPPGGGTASITRGEDGRIYVDDRNGAATHVVEPDGSVTSVATGVDPGNAALVVAAPAGRSNLVSPLPLGGVLPGNGTGGSVSLPGGGDPGPGLPLPGTPPPGHDPPGDGLPPGSDDPPETPLPGAPTGVTAAIGANNSATVSWKAADGHGLPVTYEVLGNGAQVASTSATTATVSSLEVGRSYSFTVRARTSAGTGPPSAASNTITPFGPAGPPGNLTAVRKNASGSLYTQLTWTAADLHGGKFNSYQVKATGGTSNFTKSTKDLSFQDFSNPCAPSVQYEVRALTGPPGNPSAAILINGEPATVILSSPATCTPEIDITSATATGDGEITVQMACKGAPRGGSGSGAVSLTFDGTQKWSGECRITDGSGLGTVTAVVDGLEASTDYSIKAIISSPSGSKSSGTVTARTNDP